MPPRQMLKTRPRPTDGSSGVTDVTVDPDTDVADAVKLLAEHDVGALPVVDRDGNLLGILSEADRHIRLELQSRPSQQSWTANITVSDRIVRLWGLVGSDTERKTLRALAEGVPGVARVADEMIPVY